MSRMTMSDLFVVLLGGLHGRDHEATEETWNARDCYGVPFLQEAENDSSNAYHEAQVVVDCHACCGLDCF